VAAAPLAHGGRVGSRSCVASSLGLRDCLSHMLQMFFSLSMVSAWRSYQHCLSVQVDAFGRLDRLECEDQKESLDLLARHLRLQRVLVYHHERTSDWVQVELVGLSLVGRDFVDACYERKGTQTRLLRRTSAEMQDIASTSSVPLDLGSEPHEDR